MVWRGAGLTDLLLPAAAHSTRSVKLRSGFGPGLPPALTRAVEHCVAPQLPSLTLAHARIALQQERYSLSPVRWRRVPRADRGHVLSQAPAAGHVRPPGTAVGVTVGR